MTGKTYIFKRKYFVIEDKLKIEKPKIYFFYFVQFLFSSEYIQFTLGGEKEITRVDNILIYLSSFLIFAVGIANIT